MSHYIGDRVVCIPHGYLYVCVCVYIYIYIYRERERETYTRGRIDTVDSPDDEHLVA